MCGLTAYVGKPGQKGPFIVMKYLAMANAGRGKNGVGILRNGHVYRYISKHPKENGDPISLFTSMYWRDSKYNSSVTFIHNRQTSSGLTSIENTHPFHIEVDGVNHYIAHNGTISNLTELCAHYGKNRNDYRTDTHLLATLLAEGNTDVLTRYEGSAAILWYKDNEPHTLRVFKGKSLEYNALTEERPLYAYITNNGIYLHSLKSALQCAFDVDEEHIVDLPHNVILKISNNEIVEETVHDRKNCINKSYYNSNNYQTYSANNSYHSNSGYNRASNNNTNVSVIRTSFSKIINKYSFDAKEGSDLPLKKHFLLTTDPIIKYIGNRYINSKTGSILHGQVCIRNSDGFIIDNPLISQYYTTLHFYQGFIVKDSKAYEELSNLAYDLRTSKSLLRHLDLILDFLHEEQIIYLINNKEVLLYKGSKELSKILPSSGMYYKVNPFNSKYTYCFSKKKYQITTSQYVSKTSVAILTSGDLLIEKNTNDEQMKQHLENVNSNINLLLY